MNPLDGVKMVVGLCSAIWGLDEVNQGTVEPWCQLAREMACLYPVKGADSLILQGGYVLAVHPHKRAIITHTGSHSGCMTVGSLDGLPADVDDVNWRESELEESALEESEVEEWVGLEYDDDEVGEEERVWVAEEEREEVRVAAVLHTLKVKKEVRKEKKKEKVLHCAAKKARRRAKCGE